jgi:hypothetical protein
VFKLEQAQHWRTLSSEEVLIRNELKMKCLWTGIVVQDHPLATLVGYGFSIGSVDFIIF